MTTRIAEAIASLMNHGLTDAEIASDLQTVGGTSHLALGHLVEARDLVGVIRMLLTERNAARTDV